MRFMRVFLAVVASCAALVQGAPQAPAGAPANPRVRPLDEIVSAQTISYLSIPDLSRMKAELGTTALADIWRELEVQEFVRGTLAPFSKALLKKGIDEKKRGSSGSGFANFLSELVSPRPELGCRWLELPKFLDGEISLAVEELRPDPGKKRDFRVGLALKAGPLKNPDLWRSLLDHFIRFVKENDAAGKTTCEPVSTSGGTFQSIVHREGLASLVGIWHGTLIVYITFSRDSADCRDFLARLEKGAANPLARAPDYVAAKTKLSGTGKGVPPVAKAYFSVGRVFDGVLVRSDDSDRVRTVLAALGVSSIKAVAGSLSIVDKGFLRRMVVLAPGERKGLLAALAGDPRGVFKSQAFIPAGTHGYFASRISPQALWKAVKEAAAKVKGAKGIAKMEADLSDIPETVRRDLSSALGTEIAISLKQTVGIVPIPEITLFLELADEAAARRVWEAVLAKGAARGTFKAQSSGPGAPAGSPTVTTLRFAKSPIAPACAIHKGWFVAGISSQAVKSACQRIEVSPTSPIKGIASDAAFKGAFSHLGKPTAFLTYEEGPDSFRKQYNQIVGVLPVAILGLEQAAQAKGEAWDLPEIDLATLPSGDAIARHLFGSAHVMGGDAGGLCGESFGPLSLGLVDVAGAGLVAAWVLPALHQVKEVAQTKQCAARLMDIGTGAALYKVKMGHAPQAMEDLIREREHLGFDEKDFRCPVHGTRYQFTSAAAPGASEWEMIRAWCDEEHHSGKMMGFNVLFADGHVEFVESALFEKLTEGIENAHAGE